MSALASTSALMTASLASPLLPLSSMTRLPSKPGASLVKRPSPSTVKGMAVSMPRSLQLGRVLHPDVEVLAAVAGRGVHEARAVLVGDVVAGEKRDVEIVALVDFDERMCARDIRQLVAATRRDALERLDLCRFHNAVGELVGDNERVARPAPNCHRGRCHLDKPP